MRLVDFQKKKKIELKVNKINLLLKKEEKFNLNMNILNAVFVIFCASNIVAFSAIAQRVS